MDGNFLIPGEIMSGFTFYISFMHVLWISVDLEVTESHVASILSLQSGQHTHSRNHHALDAEHMWQASSQCHDIGGRLVQTNLRMNQTIHCDITKQKHSACECIKFVMPSMRLQMLRLIVLYIHEFK